jgi:hypothetical protein
MIRIKPEPRKPVTEKLRVAVTKPASVTKPKGGRPKVYASGAERQRAYRKRRTASA